MPFGVDHSPEKAFPVSGSSPFVIWEVGESRYNDPSGNPLRVACLYNRVTGVEVPVVYHRAYGFDSLARAYSAAIVDRPEGWFPGRSNSPEAWVV